MTAGFPIDPLPHDPMPGCALPGTPLADALPGINACVHCGFCLQACPTYLNLEDENDSPRGRIFLMRSLLEGTVKPDDPSVQRHIDQCLGCRTDSCSRRRERHSERAGQLRLSHSSFCSFSRGSGSCDPRCSYRGFSHRLRFRPSFLA